MTQAVDPDALLGAIINSTDDAVLAVDRSGTVLTWNPGAESLYGYTAAEIVGSTASKLLLGDTDWQHTLTEMFQGKRREHLEITRRRKDGTTISVGETLSPVVDESGQVIAVASISRDISRRVATEDSLSKALEEIEHKNRRLERSNAELEQFAYVASHDLSEPLRAVAGMVGLLERRYKGRFDADADEFIAFAIDGCERMRTMIEDLLAFSRAGRIDVRRAPTDVTQLVEGVLTALSRQIAASRATIDIGALPELQVDPRQFAQVFQNLLSNAIKFARSDVPPEIDIRATRDGPAWRFEVADNGIGVEPQYAERIFRMFQRLHPHDAYPGTGIGLAIAERVIDRHGGTMGVTNNDLGGATFWFTIPDEIRQEAP